MTEARTALPVRWPGVSGEFGVEAGVGPPDTAVWSIPWGASAPLDPPVSGTGRQNGTLRCLRTRFYRPRRTPRRVVLSRYNLVRGASCWSARRSLARASSPAINLSWPRIVTGLARMSKSAVDVAVGEIAFDYHAITGVGFASQFCGLAFALAVAAPVDPELRTERGTYAVDVDQRTGLTRGYVRVDVDDVTDDPAGMRVIESIDGDLFATAMVGMVRDRDPDAAV